MASYQSTGNILFVGGDQPTGWGTGEGPADLSSLRKVVHQAVLRLPALPQVTSPPWEITATCTTAHAPATRPANPTTTIAQQKQEIRRLVDQAVLLVPALPQVTSPPRDITRHMHSSTSVWVRYREGVRTEVESSSYFLLCDERRLNIHMM